MKREYVPVVVALAVVALFVTGSHVYAERKAYSTGVYMGRLFFDTALRVNHACLGIPADARHNCEVKDLKSGSTMEHALSTAWIVPSLADSNALKTGFRDGWREASASVD